ncbi:hypothetical protein OHC33_011059 [Knufia fluminis]|uniref:Succinate dehydrogenase assembly factor 4, mitochondrial n=1 Tax=Knufia fluminis TaxID=191047 RepID=A0AAN8IHB5_9EURO|nr:hypothetical protein OHC33_011059 [Knufia fluminis]
MATLRPLIHAAPRHHLFTRFATTTTTTTTRRHLSTTPILPQNPFNPYSGPAPPRLPKEDQELFEALQRQSTGAFSTPRAPPQINQSPDSTPSEQASAHAETEQRAEKMASQGSERSFKDEFNRVIEARGKGEELHPAVRRGARPEFEGDVNPKTGEVGGPKNEPLRWGGGGEWSYNGRTTDF